MSDAIAATAAVSRPDTGAGAGELSYCGDVTPQEAWEILAAQKDALLVDVRTLPEWQFVGLPRLSDLGKKPLCISWKFYPTFETNTGFIEQIQKEVPDKDTPLLFLCRSGARSLDAAIAATQAGYTHAYNIAGGFEGDPDPQSHRGTSGGWKAAQLPWEQQ